jgi:hypothetical protein
MKIDGLMDECCRAYEFGTSFLCIDETNISQHAYSALGVWVVVSNLGNVVCVCVTIPATWRGQAGLFLCLYDSKASDYTREKESSVYNRR